jgi:hypothetical protein
MSCTQSIVGLAPIMLLNVPRIDSVLDTKGLSAESSTDVSPASYLANFLPCAKVIANSSSLVNAQYYIS